MQGTIAQIIALITWGNAAISGSPLFDQEGFYPANSTFTFCEYVCFVDLIPKGDSWEESPYAPDPGKWFDQLKKDGVYSLRMSYRPSGDRQAASANVSDRMLVGFVGGGGRWVIEAKKPTAPTTGRPDGKSAIKNAPIRRFGALRMDASGRILPPRRIKGQTSKKLEHSYRRT